MDQKADVFFLYWVLALGGMVLRLLLEINKYHQTESPITDLTSLKGYLLEHIFSIIASIIGAPLLIYVSMETPLSETLPVNRLTAVLLGYQTHEILNTLLQVKKR